VYRTTYGTMSLLFDGPAVTGSYTHNDGRIEGVMEGTTLTGTWRQGAKTQYVAPVRLDSGVQAITGLGGGEPPLQVWGGFGMHREEKEKGDSSLQEMLPGRECGRIDRIRDVAVTPVPVAPGDTIPTVLNRFQSDPELLVLPVVERQKVQGVINRYIFFEEHVIGRYGFGFHINHSKKIRDLMSPVALLIEGDTSFEDAVRQIQAAGQNLQRLDNICVLDGGDYAGVVDVNRFIVAMTEINLVLAKGANPLTGLPGNESIQREINNRLSKGRTFDIAYIDIDNFKPYNDYYGFQKGDVVIKALGEVITAALKSPAADGSFCGHIGGDDFIVITGAHRGEIVAESVIQGFGEHLPVFHGAEDFNAGCYTTLNRKGLRETFPLLSLSIGIVSTALTPVESYAQLASLSTDVKRAAKKLSGSAVVVNRRHLPGVLPGQEGCFGHNDMLVAQEAKRADHSSNSMREKYSP
jgi:GGDEF domain-containing protein